MKTEKEIRRYLRRQCWYFRFLVNLARYEGNNIVEAWRILRGRYGLQTINYAFDWLDTREGGMFWHGQNDLFRSWYNYGTK